MWTFLAFCSAFFAGITSILAKCGIKNIDSNLATAIRTLVILVFSWIMVFVVGVGHEISSIDSSTLLFLVLSGVATGGSWLCYFKALQIGDINKITPIDKSSTILTMILAFIFFNEPVSILKCSALLSIALGTYWMIQKKKTNQNDTYSKSAYFYALASAVCASLTSILGKMGMTNISSTLGTAIRTIIVLIMAWGIVFATKKQKTIKNIDKKSWFFLVLSGISTGISWLCYYSALQIGLASVVVPIDKLSIVVTILFSYVVFGEKLSKKEASGLFFIVVGTLLLLI